MKLYLLTFALMSGTHDFDSAIYAGKPYSTPELAKAAAQVTEEEFARDCGCVVTDLSPAWKRFEDIEKGWGTFSPTTGVCFMVTEATLDQ